MRFQILIFALSLIPASTVASTVIGNPSASIVLVDNADVYVDRVVAIECGTSVEDEFDIDETLQQWDSAAFTFDVDDDYCSVVAHVRWTAVGQVEPVDVTGFSTLEVRHSGGAVEIELNAGAETATLVD